MNIKPRIIPIVLFALLTSGCAAMRVDVDEQRAALGASELIVSRIGNDDKGLPLLGEVLKERPGKAGDRFAIAHLVQGRLETSYDVAVVGRDPDFTRPFKAVYEWTGKGFLWGLEASAITSQAASHAQAQSREEAAAVLVMAFGPLAAGTAGGFVIGVADGIRCTAQELAKVVVNAQERVVTFTTYAYDARDRLMLTRMYTAGDRREVVRTEFVYSNDSSAPSKTTITSIPEGVVRVVE